MEQHRAYVRRCLLEHRKALGLTQDEAAKQCGISRSVYAHAENGTNRGVGLERLLRLADSLRMPFKIICYPEMTPDPANGRPRRRVKK